MAKDKKEFSKIAKILEDSHLKLGDLRSCSRTLNFFIKVNKLKGIDSVVLNTILEHVNSLIKIIDDDYEKNKE